MTEQEAIDAINNAPRSNIVAGLDTDTKYWSSNNLGSPKDYYTYVNNSSTITTAATTLTLKNRLNTARAGLQALQKNSPTENFSARFAELNNIYSKIQTLEQVRYSLQREVDGAAAEEEDKTTPATAEKAEDKTASSTKDKSEPAAEDEAKSAKYGVRFTAKGNDWFLWLLPAMTSNFKSQGGMDTPNSMPGLYFKVTPNVARHRIPGFQPVHQHLGIDNVTITMVGCFTGADGSSIAQPSGANKLGNAISSLFEEYGSSNADDSDLYGIQSVMSKLDSYKCFQEFYSFAVQQGSELDVEINSTKTAPKATTSTDTASSSVPMSKLLSAFPKEDKSKADKTKKAKTSFGSAIGAAAADDTNLLGAVRTISGGTPTTTSFGEVVGNLLNGKSNLSDLISKVTANNTEAEGDSSLDTKLRSETGNPAFKAYVKKMDVYQARSDRTWYTIDLEVTDYGLAGDTPIKLEVVEGNAQEDKKSQTEPSPNINDPLPDSDKLLDTTVGKLVNIDKYETFNPFSKNNPSGIYPKELIEKLKAAGITNVTTRIGDILGKVDGKKVSSFHEDDGFIQINYKNNNYVTAISTKDRTTSKGLKIRKGELYFFSEGINDNYKIIYDTTAVDTRSIDSNVNTKQTPPKSEQ